MTAGDNIFAQPLDKLEEYSRGEHLKASKMNETIRAINDMRGVPPGRQRMPRPKGGTTTTIVGSAPMFAQEFRMLPPVAFEAHKKDIVEGRMYWPESQWVGNINAEAFQTWRIELPWILRRTPFEYIAGQTDAFRGVYYQYDTYPEGSFARTARDGLDDGADQEAQRVVPMFWTGSSRPEQEIITASPVFINEGRITRKRTDVQMDTGIDNNGVLTTTLHIESGTGDELPPLELNAVLQIQAADGGPVMDGQIFQWTSTNPRIYVKKDDSFDNPNGLTVSVNVSWYYRWQMWPDRNWALRYGG